MEGKGEREVHLALGQAIVLRNELHEALHEALTRQGKTSKKERRQRSERQDVNRQKQMPGATLARGERGTQEQQQEAEGQRLQSQGTPTAPSLHHPSNCALIALSP